jgi:hypothetical protein
MRRAAGAISEPLPTIGMLFVGVFLCLIAGVAHRFMDLAEKRRAAIYAKASLSFTLLAVGLSLSMPNTPVAGLSLLWLVIVAEEGWSWYLPITRRSQTLKSPSSSAENASPVTAVREVEPVAEPEALRKGHSSILQEANVVEADLPEAVTQQFTRSTAADGADEFAGWVRVPFAVGQRSGSMHLAFCPQFARTPVLVVEQIDGPEARIKTAQVLPYGARLDLKLQSPVDSPEAIVLQFSARVEGKGNT